MYFEDNITNHNQLFSATPLKMSDSDSAAITLLKRAVELDLSKRYTEALVCYKEGLQLLLEYIKVIHKFDKQKMFGVLFYRPSVTKRKSQNTG